MSLIVLHPGLQTSLQESPRSGFRHQGVPRCGPADALSHALANRLVGNAGNKAGLEITLNGAEFAFETDVTLALAGAETEIHLAGARAALHETLFAKAGDRLTVRPFKRGCRVYLAVAGGFEGENWLGSASTYLPAGLGGYAGRALKAGDKLLFAKPPEPALPKLRTPTHLRPHIGASWMLRACPGPDFEELSKQDQSTLFETRFTLSHRANRMGAELIGRKLSTGSTGRLPSAAVFPGTLQCPPGGHPFLLMVDAGTTGGYPRLAQLIRADRHMLGQLRPGDHLQFKRSSAEDAAIVLKEKTALLRDWLGNAFELG